MDQPTPRPFVHVNVALQADGRMGDNGKPLVISCDQDWRRVHALRESYDAVAVGANTWIGEAPRLTARQEILGRPPGRQPARVIFAGSRRCEIATATRPTFVIGWQQGAADLADMIFIPCAGRDVGGPLARLYEHGIRSMLVEGGPTLVRSFLEQAAFDRFTAYVSTDDTTSAQSAVRGLFAELPRITADRLGAGTLLACGSLDQDCDPTWT